VCKSSKSSLFARFTEPDSVYPNKPKLRTTQLKPSYNLGLNLVSLDPELSLNTIDTHGHKSNLYRNHLSISHLNSYLVQALAEAASPPTIKRHHYLQLNAITFYQIKPIYQTGTSLGSRYKTIFVFPVFPT